MNAEAILQNIYDWLHYGEPLLPEANRYVFDEKPLFQIIEELHLAEKEGWKPVKREQSETTYKSWGHKPDDPNCSCSPCEVRRMKRKTIYRVLM